MLLYLDCYLGLLFDKPTFGDFRAGLFSHFDHFNWKWFAYGQCGVDMNSLILVKFKLDQEFLKNHKTRKTWGNQRKKLMEQNLWIGELAELCIKTPRNSLELNKNWWNWIKSIMSLLLPFCFFFWGSRKTIYRTKTMK